MSEKPVQHFSKEYLERCKNLSPTQVIEFLENYRKVLAGPDEKCKPISLKVEPSLLEAFKMKAKLEGVPYQTQIKALMREWLER